MPDWKTLIAAKIALAKREVKAIATNANQQVPAGQTEVDNFPI